MILTENLKRLRSLTLPLDRVLDVGGHYQPFNLATHVIDLMPYATRRTHEALDPEDRERFGPETWIIHDVCKAPWPVPDKSFDFVFCSHLLEDVRDPIAVCAELCRVAKAGYVETPSRLREIFVKQRFAGLKAAVGIAPEIGFYHHRWFVEAEGSHLRFTAKTSAIALRRSNYLTLGQIGRKLTEAESGLGLFWTDQFSFEEAFVDLRQDYEDFGRKAAMDGPTGRG